MNFTPEQTHQMASRIKNDAELLQRGATYNHLGNLVITDRQHEDLAWEMQDHFYNQELQAAESYLPLDINEKIAGALVNTIRDEFSWADSDEKLDFTTKTAFIQMHLAGKDVSDELYGCTVVVPTNGQAVEVQNALTRWGAYVPRGRRKRESDEPKLSVDIQPVGELYDGAGELAAVDRVVDENRNRLKSPLVPANAWQKLELLDILQRLSADDAMIEHQPSNRVSTSPYMPVSLNVKVPERSNFVPFTQAS